MTVTVPAELFTVDGARSALTVISSSADGVAAAPCCTAAAGGCCAWAPPIPAAKTIKETDAMETEAMSAARLLPLTIVRTASLLELLAGWLDAEASGWLAFSALR
ncbi:hypothetical protein [Phreatobacter stygius]|uniref:hypothetical protein n=1 Tax=Phreatobacter stygius TaxID=1940610 RepID=UPI001476A480|nr:hypothetical protein [Phreatobacter stygius]